MFQPPYPKPPIPLPPAPPVLPDRTMPQREPMSQPTAPDPFAAKRERDQAAGDLIRQQRREDPLRRHERPPMLPPTPGAPFAPGLPDMRNVRQQEALRRSTL